MYLCLLSKAQIGVRLLEPSGGHACMHVHPAAQRPLCSTLLGAKSARIVCVPKRNPSFPGMLMRPLSVADLEAED